MQITSLRPHSFLPLELGLDDAPNPFSPSVPTSTPQLVFVDCRTLWAWVREQHYAAIIQSLGIEGTSDVTLNCIWIYVNLIDFDLEIKFVGVHWPSRTQAERAEPRTV
jgi:hypothetical protein